MKIKNLKFLNMHLDECRRTVNIRLQQLTADDLKTLSFSASAILMTLLWGDCCKNGQSLYWELMDQAQEVFESNFQNVKRRTLSVYLYRLEKEGHVTHAGRGIWKVEEAQYWNYFLKGKKRSVIQDFLRLIFFNKGVKKD